MALIGNGSVLHKSPGRFLNGFGTAGGHIAALRSNFNKYGMQRGAGFSPLAAVPYGYYVGAWVLPKTAGGVSSNAATLTISPVATVVGGITAPGEANITFTVADADGQLISSGQGSAAVTFTVSDALLTASIGGTGVAAFTLTSNTPILGALASGEGGASFTVTGVLVPYATGSMSGSTVDSGVLTAPVIAAEVWSSIASQFNDAGTMGAKLNLAAGGSSTSGLTLAQFLALK